MKTNVGKVIIILMIFLLSGCSLNNEFISTKDIAPAGRNANSAIPDNSYNLGSFRYMLRIRLTARIYGNKAALDTIINDVNKFGVKPNQISSRNLSRIYREASILIGQIGYVDMEAHYFRNKLNRAPARLDELVRLNSQLPPIKRWRLIPVKSSLYHMQGKDGEYNLKFVSADGFCEAVYNKDGILLTEKNDPVNMGTLNYGAGIREINSHLKYDMNPYFKWGNSGNSPQKNKADIQDGANMAFKRYSENEFKIMQYRKKVLESYHSFKFR